MVEIRKIIEMREVVLSELGVAAPRPIVRAVGMAVIGNPFAGRFVDDLQLLFEAGAMLGERLMPELVKLLGGPAVSYGRMLGSADRWSWTRVGFGVLLVSGARPQRCMEIFCPGGV